MSRTIEELKRKAEQGSQQSQGEVLELELEGVLRGRFPTDLIEPVGKGELGADVVQQVNGSIGQPAGIILWESKRTKAWSDGWLGKLRDDQRRCGADVALIVSQTLPKHVEHFDLIDGIWVTHPRCALPVAVALRQALIDVTGSRLVQRGQQTKMEQVYDYLTGMKFRQRVEAVVEKFNDMREDLDKERKFMGRQWAKRETQILAVIDSTVGMVGPSGHRGQGHAGDSKSGRAAAGERGRARAKDRMRTWARQPACERQSPICCPSASRRWVTTDKLTIHCKIVESQMGLRDYMVVRWLWETPR
jgi:hypothetical protein